MRLSLLAALAAATALIPAAASAQNHDRGSWHGGGDRGGDRGDRGGDRGDRGGNRPAPASRPAAQPHGDPGRYTAARPNGGRPTFQPGARSQRPAQFDRRPDARPTMPNRAEGFRRPDGGRPDQARPNGNWHAQAGGSRYGNRADRNDWNHDRNGGQRWNRGPNGRADGYRNGNGNRYGSHGAYDHNWRRDNRYDWQDYRGSHRSVYRLPRYYAPYGWDYGYRRFNIGFRLDSILFGANYWISDPYYYRLPPAYGPYRWVRYYDDALLVDIDTGQVVDTVYGIFW